MTLSFEALGFAASDTGGGCTAWRLDVPAHGPEHYLLVCGEDAQIPTELIELHVVGLYDDVAGHGTTWEFDNRQDCLSAVKRLIIGDLNPAGQPE